MIPVSNPVNKKQEEEGIFDSPHAQVSIFPLEFWCLKFTNPI